MKILVTYRTRTNNTKKIANTIFNEISVEKDIKPWDEVETLDTYDYVFVGFPIERMGPIEKDIIWLNEFAKGKKIILFVTHGAPEQAPYLPPWLDKCKEAVTNAVRHGKSKRIFISFTHKKPNLIMKIQDDGIGISDNNLNNGGRGLRIMKYRARTIGAVLEIKPAPNKGTIVCCTLHEKQLVSI